MLNKKIVLPVLAVAVLGVGVAFTSLQAHAQTSSNSFSGLVQVIAQKFGLEQSKVQSVVDDYRNQQKQNMQQNKQQKEQDRLDALVQEGKITDAQKKTILDEQAKLKSEYSPDTFKNLTPDQKKQQFQKEQDEIKSWAKSQNIDPIYVMSGFGMRGFRGNIHRGGWFGHKPTATPTPAS
ncbi:hypothetical protein KJ980_06315 [Patescibacteria group bacterium]|nr:hypothetical protein [Patescibacteria group bacterium]MBU4099233.1 hypothetical protein [Patescibacteria group bacterium]